MPYTSRFIALDAASIRRNEAVADQRMVDLFVFGRWAPARKVPVMIDCAGARRADLVEGVNFTEDGLLRNADWHQLDPDDPLIRAACAEV